MKSEKKVKVGISHGDINGIGYEVIIKTLMDMRINDLCTPIVYGSPKFAAYHRKAINIENFSLNHIKQAEQANEKRPNILNCVDDNIRIELGKMTEISGNSAYQSLERATQDLHDKKIDVLVTAPINKRNINSEKFNFPGHTEYLKNKFNSDEVLMMMVGDDLRLGVVTGHVPLSEVPKYITEENILKKLRIFDKSLKLDFKKRKPTIAILGLNPHAGDNSLLGSEEQNIIIPAIEKARNENIMALGPYPADGFFGSAGYKKFDAVLAMYHDQGLTPFKTIEFERGVNFTAGLSIVRTSPAHGTAFEIAGEGIASPDSFRSALFLAIDIFKNRKFHEEINLNSL